MDRFMKIVLLTLFLLFLGLFISTNTGIIDYNARAKNKITEEKIKEFEKDVEENKEIDIKNYISIDNSINDNNVSKGTLKVSNTIGKTINKVINFMFDKLNNLMNNN